MNIWHLDIKRDEWINIFKGFGSDKSQKKIILLRTFDSIFSIKYYQRISIAT